MPCSTRNPSELLLMLMPAGRPMRKICRMIGSVRPKVRPRQTQPRPPAAQQDHAAYRRQHFRKGADGRRPANAHGRHRAQSEDEQGRQAEVQEVRAKAYHHHRHRVAEGAQSGAVPDVEGDERHADQQNSKEGKRLRLDLVRRLQETEHLRREDEHQRGHDRGHGGQKQQRLPRGMVRVAMAFRPRVLRDQRRAPAAEPRSKGDHDEGQSGRRSDRRQRLSGPDPQLAQPESVRQAVQAVESHAGQDGQRHPDQRSRQRPLRQVAPLCVHGDRCRHPGSLQVTHPLTQRMPRSAAGIGMEGPMRRGR